MKEFTIQSLTGCTRGMVQKVYGNRDWVPGQEVKLNALPTAILYKVIQVAQA